MNVYRGSNTNFWLTIQSNEQLGFLDTDYLEDFHGNDGQLSLYNTTTSQRFPIIMAEVPETTPTIPHDSFRGVVTMASLPSGDYELQGRVKDTAGNYSILSNFENPNGNEVVRPMTFTLIDGEGFRFRYEQTSFSISIGLVASGLTGTIERVQLEFDLDFPIVKLQNV